MSHPDYPAAPREDRVELLHGQPVSDPYRWLEDAGAPATQESFARAAEAELEQALPLRDNAFKVPLARNLLVRTLTELCEVP